jgi:cysteine desulfurase
MIYFDYAATTPISQRALEAFSEASTLYFGNSNSTHDMGAHAKALIAQSSKVVLDFLQIKNTQYQVIYTSGATEANNLAIKGSVRANAQYGKHIITTRFEHPSVLAPLSELQKEGFEIEFAELNEQGIVDLDQLRRMVREDTILVSVQAVNSEVGIIQPILEIFAITHSLAPHGIVHTDASQAAGKTVPSYAIADLITFSGHKVYGPKGIGALVMHPSVTLIPQITGGHSWSPYRAGTPPVPLIHAFAASLMDLMMHEQDDRDEVQRLRTVLLQELQASPSIQINSSSSVVPHIVNLSQRGYSSQSTVEYLNNHGFAISAHSACASNEESSAIVAYLTKDEQRARSSFRISLSHITSEEDVRQLAKVLLNRGLLS